eukprot:CAMPEP_0182542940 /NCGR_PEP_ID=MMETSP1323-20130603/30926_1 /TAXON_ID=236787 /ORGANISM="Florenciella parvula, Strain RCC1693" /LENGTH=36 /DNA_ID= /DNA_START= /DNA_END= /DNA_ORIENTATION=
MNVGTDLIAAFEAAVWFWSMSTLAKVMSGCESLSSS